MIRVGYLVDFSKNWLGGYNYLKNLLFALNKLAVAEIEPVLFVKGEIDLNTTKTFSPLAQIIALPMLKRRRLPWLAHGLLKTFASSDLITEWVLKDYDVQVISHSNFFGSPNIKAINWIPDFQHLHLPQMFSALEIWQRNRLYRLIAEKSDRVILSSHDALKDFMHFAPKFAHKAKVLHFVAQPSRAQTKDGAADKQHLITKYNIDRDYFYLPNQLWQHKNHLVVFKALELLKGQGQTLQVVCSGDLSDHRNQNHFNSLQRFIGERKINVRLLGRIDYDDVISLMQHSLAVINPSFFEGWSTTVEECKSLGKKIILSDLAVHREQAPILGIYFDPHDPQQLSDIMYNIRNLPQPRPKSLQQKARSQAVKDLEARTSEFAKTYVDIVLECVEN